MIDKGSSPATPASAAGTLARIDIFRGLAAATLAAVSRDCRWRLYAPGQVIVNCQDDGRDIYFIVHGRVFAIHHSASGRAVRFSDILAGEIFGEFAAIDGEPRMADVIAASETLIASMPAERFWDLLRRHESVWAALLRRLTGIARTTLQRVVEFSTLPVRGRLHAELARLARLREADGNSALISPAPTHAEFASRISTHREAVTRELNELAKTGLIEKRGNDLVVRDIARLESMVKDVVDGTDNERAAERRR